MNTEKKIEQCLRAAPKPPAPDGLLDKLQADVSAQDIKTQRSPLRGSGPARQGQKTRCAPALLPGIVYQGNCQSSEYCNKYRKIQTSRSL